jgi:hypothetical protein
MSGLSRQFAYASVGSREITWCIVLVSAESCVIFTWICKFDGWIFPWSALIWSVSAWYSTGKDVRDSQQFSGFA